MHLTDKHQTVKSYLPKRTFKQQENIRLAFTDRTEHNITSSPTYRCWQIMMSRCYNTNDHCYHRGGGKGTTVSKRWHNPILWLQDVGTRPEGKMWGRRVKAKNFTPKNCMWMTRKEDSLARKRANYIKYKGEMVDACSLSKPAGIGCGSIKNKLRKGYTPQEIVRKGNELEARFTYKGKTQSVTQWALEYDMHPDALSQRINKRGMTLEEALTTNYSPRTSKVDTKEQIRFGNRLTKVKRTVEENDG